MIERKYYLAKPNPVEAIRLTPDVVALIADTSDVAHELLLTGQALYQDEDDRIFQIRTGTISSRLARMRSFRFRRSCSSGHTTGWSRNRRPGSGITTQSTGAWAPGYAAGATAATTTSTPGGRVR